MGLKKEAVTPEGVALFNGCAETVGTDCQLLEIRLEQAYPDIRFQTAG